MSRKRNNVLFDSLFNGLVMTHHVYIRVNEVKAYISAYDHL